MGTFSPSAYCPVGLLSSLHWLAQFVFLVAGVRYDGHVLPIEYCPVGLLTSLHWLAQFVFIVVGVRYDGHVLPIGVLPCRPAD